MFISPLTAIQQGWVRRSDCSVEGDWESRKFVSPNAIDFTLDELKLVERKGSAYLCEDKSRNSMRTLTDVEQHGAGYWELAAGCVYDGASKMYIEVPDGMAAILYTRSSFARNGVFIMSGLYDSGYKGHIGFTIYTVGGGIRVEPGTRIGQVALVSADAAKAYAGGWNHEEGTHYIDASTNLKTH